MVEKFFFPRAFIAMSMLGWTDLAKPFVEETLQKVGARVARDSLQTPFQLPEKDWLHIIQCVCVRLGWVTESLRSSTQFSPEILRALNAVFPVRKKFLTFQETLVIFRHLANSGKSEPNTLPPCPESLIQCCENQIVAFLRQRVVSESGAQFFSRRRGSISTVSSRRSTSQGSQSAIVPASSRASSGGRVEPSEDATDLQLVGTENANSLQLVSHPLAGMPQLPANLDDLSASELRKLLITHQADWMLAANRLAAMAPTSKSQPAQIAETRRAKRKVRYWKNKAKTQKKESDLKLHELIKSTSLYTRSKRRKQHAFRDRLTVFSGYKLALARNVGHSSCSATLSMLEADNTHRTSLARQRLRGYIRRTLSKCRG